MLFVVLTLSYFSLAGEDPSLAPQYRQQMVPSTGGNPLTGFDFDETDRFSDIMNFDESTSGYDSEGMNVVLSPEKVLAPCIHQLQPLSICSDLEFKRLVLFLTSDRLFELVIIGFITRSIRETNGSPQSAKF